MGTHRLNLRSPEFHSNHNRIFTRNLFLILFLLAFPLIAAARNKHPLPVVSEGEITAPVSLDVDLRTLPQVGPLVKNRLLPELVPDFVEEREEQFRSGPISNLPDPALEPASDAAVMPLMPTPIQNFPGMNFAANGGGWPPDTNGDVGPNHYIQVVNTSVGIYNKTGTPLSVVSFNTFFATATAPCNSANNGDPVAVYDSFSGRWLVADFAWTNLQNGPYYMCIAVSKTADPVSGGWWLYTYRADDAAHPWLNDYPKIGAWNDAFYMTSNMFDCLNASCSSASFKGVRAYALNRDDLISGAPLRSVVGDLGANTYSLFPSNYRGTVPPAGEPDFLLSLDPFGGSNLHLWKFHVDWVTPANSTITGPTVLATTAFTSFLGTVPESGGEALDSLGDRAMVQLQYRKISSTESLWVSHTVTSGGVAGLRWYEIRSPNSTPTIFQQGTFQPDALYRWMPSLAVDKDGNMAIGYSVSSAAMFPAIRYAGRLAGDAAGTLAQGEATLIAGTGSQNGGFGRWGDYSLMSVDPTDDCTFWYTTEYYTATGSNWQTRIGSFKFPSCTSAPSVPVLLSPADGSTTNDSTPTFDWQDSTGGATQYQIQLDNNSDFSSPEIDTIVAPSTFTPGSALAEGTYFWHVRAGNASSVFSAYSASFSFTIDTTPPSVPVLVTPSDTATLNDNTPTFDWNDSTGGPTQYQIQVDNNNDFSSPEIDTTTAVSTFTTGSALADNTYFWRVRSGDAAGNFSAFSTVRSFTIDTTPPSIPTLISPADGASVTDNTPTFDWNDSTGVPAQYQIQVDNNNDFSSPEIDTTVVPSTFTATPLSDATYFWRVRSADAVGNFSAYSTVRSFTIDTTPPSVPVLQLPLDTAMINDTTPDFDWADSTGGPTQYQIQVDNNNDFSSPEIDTMVVSSAFTAGSPLAEGAYFWRVRAGDALNNFSAYSTVRSFTIDTTPPSVPVLILPVDTATLNDSTPDFDWTDSTGGATQYQIQVDNNNDFSSPEIDTTTATSAFTPGSALTDNTYFWRVRSSDAAGNSSAFTAVSSFTIDTVPPSVPALISPADAALLNDSTPDFDWTDSTGGATQYQIQVDNNNDFSSPEIDTITAASAFTPGSALLDATYFWRVRAGDAVNNFSAFSAMRSFTIDTTAPSVPVLLSPADTATISDSTPDFDWTDSTGGATQYQIQVDNNNDFSSPEIDTTTATSAFTAGSALANATYFWRVRAEDALNNFSAYSAVNSFTLTSVTSCLFCDDFNDGILDLSWTYIKPAWTEGSGSLTAVPTTRKATAVALPVFSGCTLCTMETSLLTTGGFSNKLWFFAWYVDKKNTMELIMKEGSDRWIFRQRVGGKIVKKTKAAKIIDPNTAYIVRIVYNGTDFQLFVDDMGTPLITLAPQGAVPVGSIGYQVKGATAHFDYIMVN